MAKPADAARRHHQRMQVAAKDAAERERVRRYRLTLAGLAAASGLALACLVYGEHSPAVGLLAAIVARWPQKRAS